MNKSNYRVKIGNGVFIQSDRREWIEDDVAEYEEGEVKY